MNTQKKSASKLKAITNADEISKILNGMPANDNISALSDFDDVLADNDNEENIELADLGLDVPQYSQSIDQESAGGALGLMGEGEQGEELNFYDEGRQRRGFLAEDFFSFDY